MLTNRQRWKILKKQIIEDLAEGKVIINLARNSIWFSKGGVGVGANTDENLVMALTIVLRDRQTPRDLRDEEFITFKLSLFEYITMRWDFLWLVNKCVIQIKKDAALAAQKEKDDKFKRALEKADKAFAENF